MVHRFEVAGGRQFPNVRGQEVLRELGALAGGDVAARVETSDVYLIEADLDRDELLKIARQLLTDPVTQDVRIGASPPRGDSYVEVQPLPGVMDPAAEAIELAIRALLGIDARVQTGQRYDLFGVDQRGAEQMARRALANTVIHAVHDRPFLPATLPAGSPHTFSPVEVALRDLDDAALMRLSREAHLFLSLDEMKAIAAHYRTLGREPRDIELETLAQTWSEHCVHKTLKSRIVYRADQADNIDFANRSGHTVNSDGSIAIDNLLKSTIAAATRELMEDPEDPIDWCLSVFVDNSGVIAFDEEWAVCFKVETHNHPSAIEPYGGAATGIGGCIRDIIGTGLAAKPIAATDVFCVAFPDRNRNERLSPGVLHPRRVLAQVVAGVRDYGNRMGIPTLNGGVWFDDRYIGNPLVYCGVVGVMPRGRIRGAARHGDRIVAIGGRTGRDGIHGATFSSAELTETHADEFAHAVQIGNAVTEKIVLDVVLAARDGDDGPLFHAITDCGAGGFSSAIGEMGSKLGALVELERATLKYAGLTPTEIWISEAQERMILAVPPATLAALRAMCDEYGAEMADLGYFGTDERDLRLTFAGQEIGRLSMDFLHDGLPRTVREATWDVSKLRNADAPAQPSIRNRQPSIEESLFALLKHPNIASKHWIIRQYDHEVQGATAIKPLVGAHGIGPSDAAVILPVAGSRRGLAIGNGLATGLAADPYLMALAAIDECVRNLVCVGADPARIAILDNFCWPSCNEPGNLGGLVRAAEGCYDGAKAYRTPFISGKDSLNNQFTTDDGRTIEIPPTLLISGMGIVEDVACSITMDAKRPGNVLVIVGETSCAMGGSHYAMVNAPATDDWSSLPVVDLARGPRLARAVHDLIRCGVVRAAHDCSEGGILVAAAEMAFAGNLGLRLDLTGLPVREQSLGLAARAFAETPSRYLLELESEKLAEVRRAFGDLAYAVIGWFDDSARLRLIHGGGEALNVDIDSLSSAWRGTLDW